MLSIMLSDQAAEFDGKPTLQDFELFCLSAARDQRGVLWWIGDLALAAERHYPQTHHQAWPEWVSPDLIARCKAVAAAYPPKERNIHATWTTHMQLSKRGDRVAAVQATVAAGQTSDEVRKNPPAKQDAAGSRWLLAVDVNYFVHRYFHSGAGVESASTFVQWLVRLIERLRESKGLTDVVCCVDAPTNHRKELTKDWEHQYKPRADKEQELSSQLKLAPQMLEKRNLPIVSIPDMEADDVMASYAKQFAGRVTLLTQDKDMRQCLSATCNMLCDVTWEEHPETNEHVPIYKWVSAKSHTEEGSTYAGTKVVGITPDQWPHFQAIAGDSTDGIKGVDGIGSNGAMDLILAHKTLHGVIAACKDGTANLSTKKRQAVLDFAPLAETYLQLTTLRTDLPVPQATRLCMEVGT